MSDVAIRVEDVSKLYQLGEVGTGTLSRDIERWWASVRGKEDPFAKIGQLNDRTTKAESEFVWALKDINFEVKKGEVLGIIGRNGAGKSTLLKILSKITSPTKGKIYLDGRIASLLEVGTGFHPEMTGRENIFMNGAILGMRKKEIQKKFDAIVDFAGVEKYIDTPVKRYSSGMYVRLAFAVAAFLEPEILIVDEVLAVGDAEFQKKCLGRMKDVSVNEGRTVLFVSHDMNAIKNLCEKVVLIKNGEIDLNDNTDIVLQKYLGLEQKQTVEFKSDLKSVSVNQVNQSIVIQAEYDTDKYLDIPHFGFVISNALGTPLFASNPSIENLLFPQDLKHIKRGKIKIEIDSPKLLDGTYGLSVWFGNSKENYVTAKDCLTFSVSSMILNKNYNKNYKASAVGNIIPECKWSFEIV